MPKKQSDAELALHGINDRASSRTRVYQWTSGNGRTRHRGTIQLLEGRRVVIAACYKTLFTFRKVKNGPKCRRCVRFAREDKSRAFKNLYKRAARALGKDLQGIVEPVARAAMSFIR